MLALTSDLDRIASTCDLASITLCSADTLVNAAAKALVLEDGVDDEEDVESSSFLFSRARDRRIAERRETVGLSRSCFVTYCVLETGSFHIGIPILK